MTSDATGDIYVLQKGEMTISGGSGGTVTTTGALVTPTGGAASPTPNVAAGFGFAKGGSGVVYQMVAALVAVLGAVMFVAA